MRHALPTRAASVALCLAAASALCACARELSLPQLKAPPQLDAFDAGGFAGSTLALTGRNLGDPASTQVLFGARPGIVESSDGGTVSVLVPEGATSGPVTLATPQGSATGGHFTYLGLGHPASVFPRARIPLGPHVSRALPLGDTVALLDDRYHSVTLLPSPGGLFDVHVPPIFVHDPGLVFGDPAAPWVYDAGPGALRHFDLTGDAPVETQTIALVNSKQKPLAESFTPAASPDGKLFAIDDELGGVLFVDLTTGAQFDVPVQADLAIYALQFVEPARLAGCADHHLFMIDDLGGSNTVGLGPLQDDDAQSVGNLTLLATARFFTAIDTGQPGPIARLAWLREDGKIGLAEADPSNGDVPALSLGLPETIPAVLESPNLFAFAAAGATLLVGDSQAGTVLSFSFDPGQPVVTPAATQSIAGLVSLETISSGPAAGLVAAGSTDIDGAFLLLPGGSVVRKRSASAQFNSLVAEDADVLVTSAYGTLQLNPLQGEAGVSRLPQTLSVLERSEGGIAGYTGAELYRRVASEPAGFVHVATAAHGVSSAALSGDGRWLAAFSSEGFAAPSFTLQLFPLAGNSAPAPPPALFPGGNGAFAVFSAGVLYALVPGARTGSRLVRFAPGTLDEAASQTLEQDPYALFAGTLLGGVVSATVDLENQVSGPSRVQVWTPAGDFGEQALPDALLPPQAASADGRLLVSVTSNAAFSSTATSSVDVLEVLGPPASLALPPRLHVDPGFHVGSVASSLDGARFYATLLDANALVLLE